MHTGGGNHDGINQIAFTCDQMKSNEATLNNAEIIEWKKNTLRGPGDITQQPYSQIYFQKSKEIVTMQARHSDSSVVHTGYMTS